MNTLTVRLMFLATVLLICAADNLNNQSLQRNSENDARFDERISELLAKNVLQLSQEIGTTILQDSDKPTEVFSPLSIYTALSILLMGANGQTFQELMSLLKINNGKLSSFLEFVFASFCGCWMFLRHCFQALFFGHSRYILVSKYMESARRIFVYD